MAKLTLLTQQAVQATDLNTVGHKAKQLGWLSSKGYFVPPFVVAPTTVCQHLWQAQPWFDLLNTLSHAANTEKLALAKHIRTHINAITLDEKYAKTLRKALHAMTDRPEVGWSVRASSTNPQTPTQTHANLLNVRGIDALLKAYLCCIASTFSDAAVRHRLTQGLPEPLGMAVMFQTMVFADRSGVCFTANPHTGRRDESVLSAGLGLGAGTLTPPVTTDQYTWDVRTNQVQLTIVDKPQQRQAQTQGVALVPVPAALQHHPVLTQGQAKSLFLTCDHIAKAQGCAQVVEWALEQDQVYILQIRPLTRLPPLQTAGQPQVWDNTNMQAHYAGMTTPLTFSFAAKTQALILEQRMRLLRMPAHIRQQQRSIHPHVLGLVKGRLYNNINYCYQSLHLLPLLNTHKRLLQQMMGLQDPVDLPPQTASTWWQRIAEWPRRLPAYAHVFWALFRLDAGIERFKARMTAATAQIDRSSLQRMDLQDLVRVNRHLRDTLFAHWDAPLLNDVLLTLTRNQVAQQLQTIGCEQPQRLIDQLLMGEEDIACTEPTKLLLGLTQAITHHPDLISAFKTHPKAHWMTLIESIAPDIHQACQRYIEDYGDRCMGELKLESISLREDPSFMLSVIENFLPQDTLTVDHFNQQESEIRAQAEQHVFDQFEETRGSSALSGFKKRLHRLRQTHKNQASLDMDRARAFGLTRSLYREIGSQLVAYAQLEHTNDVFYLTVDEIEHYTEGSSVTTHLKPLVAQRKAEFSAYADESLPHHFYSHSVVYLNSSFTYPFQSVAEHNQRAIYTGIGCYPGTVEGKVRLVQQPADASNLNGDILCAEYIDLGWLPLLLTAGGLLIEQNSGLSHLTNIAQMFKIPTLVGVPEILQVLQNGQEVRLNGTEGHVEILPGLSAE